MRYIFVIFFFLFSVYFCFSQRYTENIFSEVLVKRDIVYGRSLNINNIKIPLTLDLYSPAKDTLKNRPCVILIHGGSFFEGDKLYGIPSDLCLSLAKKGYVCASINYRLDVGINNRAILNAASDALAANRYLKRCADEYALDTSKFVLGGESAGAIAALAASYFTSPDSFKDLDSSKACLDNPEVSSSVKACLDISGYLEKPELINDVNLPRLLIIHGIYDYTISFNAAIALQRQAYKIGLNPEFVPVEAGHKLIDKFPFLDSIITRFLYKRLIIQDESRAFEPVFPDIRFYPNPLNDYIGKLFINNKNSGILKISMYDFEGNLLKNNIEEFYKSGEYTIPFSFEEYQSGCYFLKINAGHEEKIIKIVFNK